MRNKFAEIIYKESIKNSKICVVVADISPAGSMDLFRTNILKIRKHWCCRTIYDWNCCQPIEV